MKHPYTQLEFSIADLEHISSINKATIRIWEKRYTLFNPKRSSSNIRSYSLDDLKKLMNISYLISKGYKISKIAQMSKDEVHQIIHKSNDNDTDSNYYIEQFLIYTFEYNRFELKQLYDELATSYDFKTLYVEIVIPLLIKIGKLWQTEAIDISHEHFLVHFLKERLFEAIGQLDSKIKTLDPLFILFLPENEIHELSLIFIHYLMIEKGLNTIMLGASVPIEGLAKFKGSNQKTIFYTHLTNTIRINEIRDFFKDFEKLIQSNEQLHLWVSGSLTAKEHKLFPKELPVTQFVSIKDLDEALEKLQQNDKKILVKKGHRRTSQEA